MKLIPLNIENKEQVIFMYEVRTSPLVMKNLIGSPPENFEAHYHWLNSQRGVRHIFIIEEEIVSDFGSSVEKIGYCQIYNIKNTSLEMGWAFHPSFHSRGLGRRAVKLLIEECNTMYYKRDIELCVKNNNLPAIISYIKEGFIPIDIKQGLIYMKKSNG